MMSEVTAGLTATRAELYRNEAKECEADASKIHDGAIKERMLELAQLWARLADELEHAPKSSLVAKTPTAA